jgi:transposase InsO family protein
LLVDTSSGVLRPLMPQPFRRQLFETIHSLAHPGIRASRRLIGIRFLWPNLAKDVAEWCRQCTQCQAAKVTRQPAAEVQPIPTPIQRFSHVHVGLVGPFPLSTEGYAYLLTAVDRTSRWFEAMLLRSVTAADVAEAFVAAWVARFGVPATITSDRGVQFSSALWAAAMKKLGIKHLMTTAFHPQSNGLVERAHRRLKEALKARLEGADWPQHLPYVLLGLRAAPREDSCVSAAELLYGAPLSLPGQPRAAAEPPAEGFRFLLNVALPPSSGNQIPTQLFSVSHVYIKAAAAAGVLSPAYRGPFLVVRRSPKYFILQLGSRYDAISVDRLKPHLGSLLPTAAAPATRGRPRKSI